MQIDSCTSFPVIDLTVGLCMTLIAITPVQMLFKTTMQFNYNSLDAIFFHRDSSYSKAQEKYIHCGEVYWCGSEVKYTNSFLYSV